VASQIAAQTLNLLYYQHDRPVPMALAEGFAVANKVIHDHGKAYPDCAGLGTTCTALVIRDDQVWLGHIGDSRAYIVRDGEIHQLSEDHSLVAQLVRDGTLTPVEARASPDRNILLRALGTQPSAEPSIWTEGLPLTQGDVLVLCSDGLCDLVENSAIADAVVRFEPFEACERLINAALAAGGHDNISVGIFAIVPRSVAPIAAERPTRRVDFSTLPGIVS
jgi:PPM family protein phosphatase